MVAKKGVEIKFGIFPQEIEDTEKMFNEHKEYFNKLHKIESMNKQNVFIHCLSGWKRTSELTAELPVKKPQGKRVSSQIGYSCKYLLTHNWVNTKKIFVDKKIDTTLQRSKKIPHYKSNINYFLDTYRGKLVNRKKHFLKRETIGRLHLFFELQEVRDLLMKDIFISKKSSLYDSYERIVQNYLIKSWLIKKERLNYKFPKLNITELKQEIQTYLNNRSSDSKKLDIREEIVNKFESVTAETSTVTKILLWGTMLYDEKALNQILELYTGILIKNLLNFK